MRTPSNLSIGSPTTKDYLLPWAQSLDSQLRYIVGAVSSDLRQGNARLEVFDDEPEADDLDTGQRVLHETDDGDVRMYTVIDDKLYYTKLTEVT